MQMCYYKEVTPLQFDEDGEVSYVNEWCLKDDCSCYEEHCTEKKITERIPMRAINIEWDTDGEDIELPTEIDIPEGLVDEDTISDYISDVTGFCHFGFELEERS